MSIPQSYHDLFEKQTFAHFATVLPDGTPHVTPVWVDYDDAAERVLINTVTGRRKERNATERPQVGISMIDPDDPYRFCSITGRVSDVTTDGAVDHINRLAERYMGTPEYPGLEDESGDRVILRIRPQTVRTG